MHIDIRGTSKDVFRRKMPLRSGKIYSEHFGDLKQKLARELLQIYHKTIN